MEKCEPTTSLRQNSEHSFSNSHSFSLFSVCIPALDHPLELCLHGYILTDAFSVSMLLLQRLKPFLVALLYVSW